MENQTPNTNPEPQKKNYGSVLLIIGLVGVLIYFCGSSIVKVFSKKTDSTAVVIDSAKIKSVIDSAIIIKADSSQVIAVDTTSKIVTKK